MIRSAMNLKRRPLRHMLKDEDRAVAEAWKSVESIATPIRKNVMILFQKVFLRKENAKPATK